MYQILLNDEIYEGTIVIRKNLLSFESTDGEPLCDVSKFVPGLAPGEYAIKSYSENEGLYMQLVELQLIEPAHRYVRQGFVEFPICRLVKP